MVGKVAFEPLPEPLDWIQFGGNKAASSPARHLRAGPRARDMGRSIVQHEDMEALGIVLRQSAPGTPGMWVSRAGNSSAKSELRRQAGRRRSASSPDRLGP